MVLRLHAAARAAVWMGDPVKNSPMDGAYGGTYCAPMWAKFFASALSGANHPGFADLPVDLQPLEGQDAADVAVAERLGIAVAVAVGDQDHQADRQADPEADADRPGPGADHGVLDVTPTVTPTAKKAVAAAATRPLLVAATTGDGTTGLAGTLGSWLAGDFRL